MSFALYLIVFVLIWALITAGVAIFKIAIICVIILGIAVLTGVIKTRPKDPPKGS